jgi:serine/threonine protein kinase
MPVLEPGANEEFPLRIWSQDRRFQALEHPSAPGFAHAMEGGKAFVYRIRELGAGTEYALKVMKTKHRDPALEEVCGKLDALKTAPGMGVCERCCLSPASAPDAIKQYKNLAYAILMPWVDGFSWFDVLYLGKRGRHSLSKEQSVTLALNFADVLARLEAMGVAHCDLSAGNIVIDTSSLTVELIDVEDFYAPNFQTPAAIPYGTPGYQHKASARGQWGMTADRFAAAILLSEMLGWHDAKVKSASYGETYFDPAELQTSGSRRLDVLTQAVASHRNGQTLVELLRAAWESDTFEACPPLAQWSQAISSVKTGISFSPLRKDAARSAGNTNPAAWAPLPAGAARATPTVTWSDAIKPGGGQAGKPADWSDPLTATASRPPKPVVWGDVSDPEEEVEDGSTS